MPLVNLIFEQRKLLKAREQKARGLLIAAASALVLGVGVNGIVLLQGEGVKTQIAITKKQLTRIQPIVKDIESTSKQMAQLQPRLTSLEDAQKVTKKWATILDHIRRTMPEGVWLTQLRSKEGKDGGKVLGSLIGLSLDQEGVAQFMLRLRTCEDIESVDLKFTQGEYDGSRTNIKYEIEIVVAGIGQEDKKTKKKKRALESSGEKRSTQKEAS